MATAEVLRAHNILLPAPHRIRPASSHRRPSSSSSSNPAGGPARRSSPPAGRRNHHGRKAAARPAAYAGPAFSTSPEPSALPLPQFPVRKAAAAAVDDAATHDLRRILRLE
ncbi:unnamed protein product [Urochloa humidicola]